jgi:peptidoglycan/LPS O-acetylase OafA/YrhL
MIKNTQTRCSWSDGYLNSLWDADAAVLYFFILSGFVLSESLEKIELSWTSYLRFTLKRILRIYPAFLVVLFLSFLSYHFYSHSLSGWLMFYWQNEPNWMEILKQGLLIIRLPNDPALRILPHDWTLSIEILISLFLPFMALISKRNPLILLSIVFLMIKLLPIESFAWEFALGVVIATKKEFLIRQWKKMNVLGHSFLIVLAIAFIVFNSINIQWAGKLNLIVIHHKSIGLSILLIFLLASTKLQSILSNEFIHFHGKVSYSLYLVHLIVIAIVFHFFPSIDLIPGFLICYATSMILATISYNLIEKSIMRLTKVNYKND